MFDCETKIDAPQQLRFGTYQIRRSDRLHELGLFYDPEGVSASEVDTLKRYAAQNGLTCLTRQDFTEKVFLRFGFDRRATIVGFNLPFDISRIATSHGPARGSMRGGFSFELSPCRWWPRVRVKHLSRRAAGRVISSTQLKTYAEALAQFHLHPEDKFLNGDFLDRGRTERRHILASGVRLIGKEANKWEEQGQMMDADASGDYGPIMSS